jgi:putative ABC transport system permease protein
MRQVASVFGFGFAKLHVSPFVLLAGVGLGAVTAVVASYVPARRSRALDLAAELHGRATRVEETLERSRVRLAIWVVTGAVAILLSQIAQRNGAMERWQPPLATGALALASVSLIAAVGAAAPLLLAVALRALRTTSGPIRVAVANLVANPRRTSVVATAAGASVALACVFATLGPAIQGVVSSIVGKAAGGRVWVSTLDANNSGTVEARPSRRVLATLASLPGIEAVDESPCTSVVDDAGLVSVCAYDGGRTLPFETIAGRVDARAFDQGEVILGPGAARSRGLRPGSVFRMRTPTGFIPLTVAGIWDNLQANGYSATVSPRRFTELFGRLSPASVFVRPTAGVSAAELVRRIGAADLDPDLYALTPASYVRRLSSEIGEQVTPFWSLQRAVLFTALVAAMSTLLLVGVQRRRELGVLGAVGFGPAGLARMTLVEAAAAGFSGAVLGVVASLGLFVVFSSASLAAVGHTLPFRFETPSAIVAVGLAVVVVAVGGLLPAWRTARLQIVDAIRDE